MFSAVIPNRLSPLRYHHYHRYKVGDMITVKADAMMGRTTDLVFTLHADDFIMMCHPCLMGMTSKAGDTACYPITECDAGTAPDPNKRIFTTKDALLASVTGSLEGTITATNDRHVSSSSITTSGKGSGLVLRYSSTTTKITSITVVNSGYQYVTRIARPTERGEREIDQGRGIDDHGTPGEITHAVFCGD